MRRLLTAGAATLAFTGTILVLPVSAEPGPVPVPVPTSEEQVEMGSVADPAPAADVQQGTTEPVAGVPATAPALTVRETDTDEFSLVGVTWAHDGVVPDVVVQVRVQDPSGAWGEWTEVVTEDAAQEDADNPSGELRGGTEPLWTGPSTGVEAELVTRSGAAPRDVRLELVDPGASAADAGLGAAAAQDSAHAATAAPTIYTRRQWGADERSRTWEPSYAPTIRAAVIHHTAGANGYRADEVPAIIRAIYHYHAVSRGWGDIGYNVMVDRFGRAFEGRYGGLASTVIGAHAGGFNDGTFGISVLGNHDTVPMPTVAVDTVAAAVAWKLSLHGVDPRGRVTLTSAGGGTSKYPAGTQVRLPTVFAHRDVGNTTCPGEYGYARMPGIRERVAAIVESAPHPTIAQRLAEDAELQATLGAAVGGEQVTAGVTEQHFERGSMYWTAATGAHPLIGAVRDAYLAAGGPAALGAPMSDDTPALDGTGSAVHLTRGASVYSSPSTGAHVVQGAIRMLWEATGGHAGPLGYPTTSRLAGGGGTYNDFQRGIVLWSAATGAVEVHGPIATRWRELGGLSWGVPTSSQQVVGSAPGRYNTFSAGRAIYWSPATGARVVQGAILRRWTALGGAAGALGLPTSDPQAAPGGATFATFQRGAIYRAAPHGPIAVLDPIAAKWAELGGLGAGIGVPITPERPAKDGVGRYHDFSRLASIYWSPATGAWSVGGGIRARWARLGRETGPLGYPTSDARPTADGLGREGLFRRGAVYARPGRGPVALVGPVNRHYRALGGVQSALGWPTGEVVAVAGGRTAEFERGRITWHPPTGTMTVTYR